MSNTADLLPLTPDAAHPVSSPPEMERRAQRRHPSGQVVYLGCQSDAGANYYQLVTIWNASTGGVGLFLKRPVEPGTVFHIQFRHLAVRDRIATVRHIAAQEGAWLVGCELDTPLSPGELRALRF